MSGLRSLAPGEHVGEFTVASRNLDDRGLTGRPARSPGDKRFPEIGPADGKADESRHARGYFEPFVNLAIVLAAAQDDATHLFSASASRGDHNFFAIVTTVQTLDLPQIRFDPSIL